MAIDLTGGLPEEREFVFATQPDEPEMRESVNAWLWDDGGTVAMPRIGIEAVADQWKTHDVQVNIAFADGRVLNIFGPGPVHDPLGADSKPRILGAGPLSFELVEPYRHWKLRLDGRAAETSVDAQVDGWAPGHGGGPTVPVTLEVDLRSAVPPAEWGTLLDEARHVLMTQEEGALMGGPRFEQLCRITGTLRVGDDNYAINGGGLRIRRQGVRRLATFRGHVWQSTIFPSGRAFGLCLYPPRTDGKPTFNEGFLFEGDGDLIPARVVGPPWLRRLEPKGQDVSVTLETDSGTTTIHGETLLSTFHVMNPQMGADVSTGFNLQQAVARYTWDGETANGMIERSTSSDELARP
jgi:prepilin-type processing-associated H-X9-DG protein